MTDGDDHDRFFRIGAIQQTIEKPHWVWRMGEGNETCMVKGCQQHAGRDADAFRHVIILVARAVIEFTEALSEHHDQPGRDLQMRLFRPGADRLQGLQPFVAGAAVIETPFFLFRRLSESSVWPPDLKWRRNAMAGDWPHLGAVPAAAIQCSITPRGTGRLE